MTERIFNFSAGPAVIPVPVLEEAQANMLALPGVGMSVMEISHRSKTFDEIIQGAEAGLRELLNIPKDYAVLFLQGGASLQFAMVPMNFLLLEDFRRNHSRRRSRTARAAQHSQRLRGAFPARRRQPSVRDGADEFSFARRECRLHRHRQLG